MLYPSILNLQSIASITAEISLFPPPHIPLKSILCQTSGFWYFDCYLLNFFLLNSTGAKFSCQGFFNLKRPSDGFEPQYNLMNQSCRFPKVSLCPFIVCPSLCMHPWVATYLLLVISWHFLEFNIFEITQGSHVPLCVASSIRQNNITDLRCNTQQGSVAYPVCWWVVPQCIDMAHTVSLLRYAGHCFKCWTPPLFITSHFKTLFLFMRVCTCVGHGCTCEWKCPWRAEEEIRYLRAGVTGYCELLDLGPRTSTLGPL